MLELWSHPWWVLGLISLTALFMLLFGLFIASYRVLRRGMGGGPYGSPSHPNIEITFQGPLTFSGAYMQGTPAPGSGGPKLLNTWVTRIFAAIVLQCAAIYLISQFPGFQSPFWLGIVLQAYTYGSAYLFYASSWDDQS
jgi:hypothetical protein